MNNFANVADLKDQKDQEGRTYREINNATKHTYKVGQLVEIDHGVRMFVAHQGRDCDGEVLYCLTPFKHDTTVDLEGFANKHWLNGIGEDDMKAV